MDQEKNESDCFSPIPMEYFQEALKGGYESVIIGKKELGDKETYRMFAFIHPDGRVLLKRFYQKELDTISPEDATDAFTWDITRHGPVTPVYVKEPENIINKENLARYARRFDIELF